MADSQVLHKVNIRDLSIKCGRCGEYQTLTDFERADGYNVYIYECDNDSCAPDATRTLLEVPTMLDVFYQKHPDCGGTGD